METIKILKEWGNGTRTVLLSDGSSAIELPDTDNIRATSYPKLNKNTGHQYVIGRLEPGKGYESKTGVLSYEQNGYIYNNTGSKIVGKGRHIKGEKS